MQTGLTRTQRSAQNAEPQSKRMMDATGWIVRAANMDSAGYVWEVQTHIQACLGHILLNAIVLQMSLGREDSSSWINQNMLLTNLVKCLKS